MSSTLNRNQVYLISYREDVVLFCSRVFQKIATIQRINCISEVPDNLPGIVVYDAIDNAITLEFFKILENSNHLLISIISPCICFTVQKRLKELSAVWVYSNLSEHSKKEIERFVNEASCNENNTFYYGNSMIAQNQSLQGLFTGISGGIQKFREDLQKVSRLDTPVLLLGETGCGKTTAARLIHELSDRRNGPFVHVNVGEVVPSLCESTFFGKTSGAYTDAKADTGFCHKSNHGIIFFDEIGLSKQMVQGSLLTFLENQMITPVGSTKSEKLDTRIILATNADIKSMIMEGSFRRDFFHRIDNHVLTIPSLRQRPEDIPYIAKQYIREKKCGKFLSNQAIDKMMNYDWPGNIRELQHCMDRAVEDCLTEKIPAEAIDFGLFN